MAVQANDLVSDDIALVRAKLREISGRANYPSAVYSYYLNGSGRLFRPLLALASFRLFTPEGPLHERAILSATIVELLHAATLCHDDLCDAAEIRRGEPAIQCVFGVPKALVAGDYLMAQAMRLAAGIDQAAAVKVSDTLVHLCDGQMRELNTAFNHDRTYDDYSLCISGKTGSLIALAAHLGAAAGGACPEHVEVMAGAGMHFGRAFQILDDIQDVWPAGDTGKRPLLDVLNGIWNLPVIIGLDEPSISSQLKAALEASPPNIEVIEKLLELPGVRRRCQDVLLAELQEGLAIADKLPFEGQSAARRLLETAIPLMPELQRLLAKLLSRR